MSDSAPPPPPPSEPTGPTGSTGPTGPTAPTGPGGPPPGQYPASHSTSGMTSDQMKTAFQGAHKYDLGIIAAGVLAFFFSLFPYYKGSVSTSGSVAGLGDAFGSESGTWSAWHGFFGWFAALLALVAAGLLIAHLLRVALPFPLRLTVLGLFGAALLCTLLSFFVSPLPGNEGKQSFGGVTIEYSKGVGWGFWLFLLVIIAGTALAFMRKDATD